MRWSSPARAGLAALFVANLYEGVVDVPRLLLAATALTLAALPTSARRA